MSFMSSSSPDNSSSSSQRYYRHPVFRSCSEEESTNNSNLTSVESPTKSDATRTNSNVVPQRIPVAVVPGASVSIFGNSISGTNVTTSTDVATSTGSSSNPMSSTSFPSKHTVPLTTDTSIIRMNDDRSSAASTAITTSSAMVQVVPSHSVVPLLRTDDTMKSMRVANSSACCHPVMTSITPRHQGEENTAEEVVIEEDDDARSSSFAISYNGEEEDPQVQDLESVEEQEESDYEYDYEDDDDGHFTGFLASTAMEFQNTTATNNTNGANIIEDCQQPIPLENTSISGDMSDVPRQEEAAENRRAVRKTAWKEPSQAAVTMSLRVERETCGGKRRLASDLYKIMVGDTTEQGFTLEPTNEDSMDSWKIKLFGFDPDSNLQKDMDFLGLDHIELEMTFPDDYPFAPPFVRVVQPRFKRQTGFVMDGALCMELLTSEGWNPVNDIESVIVSIRSLIVVGDGRISAAERLRGEPDGCRTIRKKSDAQIPPAAILPGKTVQDAIEKISNPDHRLHPEGNIRAPHHDRSAVAAAAIRENHDDAQRKEVNRESSLLKEEQSKKRPFSSIDVGRYTEAESRAAYSHLSEYHKKKGWSRWWARKG